MPEKTRPTKFTVVNTTGAPLPYNEAGGFVFPGEPREADPKDPTTKALLVKGDLIVKEG